MRWILAEKSDRTEVSLCDGGPCAFLTEDGRVLVPAGPGPACIFSATDVHTAAAWKLLQTFVPVHPIRLAAYLERHFPDMPGSELCALMGIKTDYRGLADAEDARHLDEASVHLAETYDLPLHVVRLFSRISQREKLLSLFQERSVRKNLIREIVQDLYDLQEDKRAAVIEEMMAYSEGWTSRSSVFPAEELRDLVRTARYPRSEQLRREIRTALARMNLPPGVQMEVPADLENGKPRITVEFSTLEDLTRLASVLTGNELRAQAAVILAALQQK